MSDPIPTNIRIGGPVPRALLNDLADAIDSQGVGLNWDESRVTAAEALSRIQEAAAKQETVEFTDPQAGFGQFDDLENFLNIHHIHYDRHSDGKYEFNAEWVCGRGGEEITVVTSDQEGNFLVDAESLNAVLMNEELDSNQKLEAIGLLANPVAPLESIRIVEG